MALKRCTGKQHKHSLKHSSASAYSISLKFADEAALCADEAAILSDSSEECLRPSLLRKRRHLQNQHSLQHCENTPANAQSLRPDQKASSARSTKYDSPIRQTPFTALFPSCPTTGAASQAAFSPAAQDNLFGSPALSLSLAFSPVLGSNLHGTPAAQLEGKHSHGVSMLMAQFSHLQSQHQQLTQQLKVKSLGRYLLCYASFQKATIDIRNVQVLLQLNLSLVQPSGWSNHSALAGALQTRYA